MTTKDYKEKLLLSKALQEELEEALKEHIEDYVDEGEVLHIFSDFFTFKVRKLKYVIAGYSGILDINPEGCERTIPSTVEEMQKMADDNKVAQRCARQAYMQYKYLY